MNESKEIKYLNRDFESIKNTLIEFAKIYYPNEYNDFSDTSIGMMFIEMCAYVSDVLSLYTDIAVQESLITTAKNPSNIINIANSFGYKPRLAGIAYSNIDIFVLIPSKIEDNKFVPNFDYAPKILDLEVTNDSGIIYRTNNIINFAESASNPTEISFYSIDDNGNVEKYLLKKNINIFSGEVVTETFNIGNPEKYLKLVLSSNKIIEIISVFDSEGNQWYEVPYLAHDTIVENVPTEQIPEFEQYKYSVPYILRYKKVSRRFISRVRPDGKIELQFGSGINYNPDELIIPNIKMINYKNFDIPIDPRNFLNTRTYGLVPSNTTLTVKYLVGYGEEANCNSNEITSIRNMNIVFDNPNLNPIEVENVKNSIAVNNPIPAVGARGPETIEEIRQNTMAFFSSQDRCVTAEDYKIRILSMNPKYGSVAKVAVVNDYSKYKNKDLGVEYIDNPFAINIYCLGYDKNKNLIPLNDAVKYNIKQYLNQYRIITDAINIKDAYIINIGVEFEIITYQNVINKKEVILNCIEVLKDYFNIDKWQIGQPIILSEIYNLLDNVSGVRTVKDVKIKNLYDVNGIEYSNNFYDIATATINGIIYPSLDPSCFEVKYPNKDILGRAL